MSTLFKVYLPLSVSLAVAACGGSPTSTEAGDDEVLFEATALELVSSDEEADPSTGDAVAGMETDPAAEAEEAADIGTQPARRHVNLNCRFVLHRAAVRDRLDANGDGQLDEAERAAARAEVEDAGGVRHRRIRPEGRRARSHLLRRLRWAYDLDGDHHLDAAERAAFMSGLESRCELRRDRIIAEFDTDGDGALSAEERETAAAAIQARRQARRDAFVANYDANGDGQLDRQERALLRDDLRARASDRRDAVRANFDANADGVLDAAEKDALKAAIRDRFENGAS